jgi:hypothetical protein
MARAETIAVYGSQSPEYHEAFQIFLDHTDQKLKAQKVLSDLIDRLPSRRVLIDAGAGNGKVTSWFTERFGRTIAIEPNASLRHDLQRACPAAQLIPEQILNADIETTGDLILCSHVFYYIDASEWMQTLARLTSWVAPGGLLVLVVQNHNTDCMRMLNHFLGRRFLVSLLARQFQEERPGSYDVQIDTSSAQIETPDFRAAYAIAEFMLNLLPLPDPPPRRALENYVRAHFECPNGSFRFSCDQDFIQIRKCD